MASYRSVFKINSYTLRVVRLLGAKNVFFMGVGWAVLFSLLGLALILFTGLVLYLQKRMSDLKISDRLEAAAIWSVILLHELFFIWICWMLLSPEGLEQWSWFPLCLLGFPLALVAWWKTIFSSSPSDPDRTRPQP